MSGVFLSFNHNSIFTKRYTTLVKSKQLSDSLSGFDKINNVNFFYPSNYTDEIARLTYKDNNEILKYER